MSQRGARVRGSAMHAAHCHRDALHARAHPAHSAIMQNCAIDDVMMAHVARKEHTMAPYATAATHADPNGPHSRHQDPPSRPRSAPQREMGGRQHRGSMLL